MVTNDIKQSRAHAHGIKRIPCVNMHGVCGLMLFIPKFVLKFFDHALIRKGGCKGPNCGCSVMSMMPGEVGVSIHGLITYLPVLGRA